MLYKSSKIIFTSESIISRRTVFIPIRELIVPEKAGLAPRREFIEPDKTSLASEGNSSFPEVNS